MSHAISQSNEHIFLRFNGANLDDTGKQALQDCERDTKEPCRLLVQNFDVTGAGSPAAPRQ